MAFINLCSHQVKVLTNFILKHISLSFICLTVLSGQNDPQSSHVNDMFPQWSAGANRIVFTSDRDGDPEIYVKDQIYTMRADGTDVQRLTVTEFNDRAAFWSPDNKSISFTSDREDNSEIYLMKADGTNVRRLTHSRATERAGVWSPDGKHIAFSSDGDGPSQIYVMNADGSNQVRLSGRH